MRLPRDISGFELSKRLEKLGYILTRQVGSHMRLSTERNGTHHITIPAHIPLKIGTLNAILREISEHHALSRPQLLSELFG
jgi:predicted RNA binding protein YcfA (HicA-like mRNA interferase family)